MVPHFLSPLGSCRLRVVDNDSCSEVPTVSCSVTPHFYHPNKVAECTSMYDDPQYMSLGMLRFCSWLVVIMLALWSVFGSPCLAGGVHYCCGGMDPW